MRPAIRITKFGEGDDGILRARVTPEGGETVAFERAPVWVTAQAKDGTRREALPWVAAALQAKLPAAERRRP
jgi:hypothetical protein